jgi:hypothetical protein
MFSQIAPAAGAQPMTATATNRAAHSTGQHQADFSFWQYRWQYGPILKTRFPLYFLAQTRFCEIPVGGILKKAIQQIVGDSPSSFSGCTTAVPEKRH